MDRRIAVFVGVTLFVVSSGCTLMVSKRSPWDIQRLEELSDELERFKTLAHLQQEEADRFRQAKAQLQDQVSSSNVSVGYDERGLVTRLMDRVLFDSGKAQLRFPAYAVLDRVAGVLKNEVPDQPVAIEGHTDNESIKHSGWASNHELSVARANAVADYLVNQGVTRNHLIVVGYGEDRPISVNDTVEGRQKNRRVEIVVMPKSLEGSYKTEAGQASGDHTTFSK